MKNWLKKITYQFNVYLTLDNTVQMDMPTSQFSHIPIGHVVTESKSTGRPRNSRSIRYEHSEFWNREYWGSTVRPKNGY